MVDFAGAFAQSLVESLNPMNQMVNQMAESKLADNKLSYDERVLKIMDGLQSRITAGRAASVDQKVIDGWQSMLDGYAAKIIAS